MAATELASSFSTSQRVTKPAGVSMGGVVAAQHRIAAEIGAEVLRAGGDAVDAAVAVSYAIGVLEPWMSGPAGGGAMMIWRADSRKALALNYGMRAPQELDPADYPLAGTGKASDLFPWEQVVDDRNLKGATAIAVPGTVSGTVEAHARFGRMPWAELLAPAVRLARRGMKVDWYATLLIASEARMIAEDPDAAAMFLDDGCWPKSGGWTANADLRIDQSRMADTLDRLAQAGGQDFYTGDVAAALVADVRAKGGSLSAADLAGYRAEWQAPLSFGYRAATVHATPVLTAGPTLKDALEQLAPFGAAPDAASYVATAGALRAAYVRRLSGMGDHEAPKAPGCTTHFSIVDRQGNMVAMTQTLLSVFGSKVVGAGTGLMMNNGIMWFDPEPGKPNALAPGRRCLMNVCPILVEDGARVAALGASGGRKIMPAVAQLASFITDFGMDLDQAFHQPRIDASGGEVVTADESLPPAVLSALAAAYPTETAKRMLFPYAYACPAGVMRDGTRNSGATEIMSPWGDAIVEE